MKWQDVTSRYFDCWVLFEAMDAHSADGKRIVDNLSVLDTFPSWEEAMKSYRQLHTKASGREMYIAHTRKKDLEIRERRWMGVRL